MADYNLTYEEYTSFIEGYDYLWLNWKRYVPLYNNFFQAIQNAQEKHNYTELFFETIPDISSDSTVPPLIGVIGTKIENSIITPDWLNNVFDKYHKINTYANKVVSIINNNIAKLMGKNSFEEGFDNKQFNLGLVATAETKFQYGGELLETTLRSLISWKKYFEDEQVEEKLNNLKKWFIDECEYNYSQGDNDKEISLNIDKGTALNVVATFHEASYNSYNGRYSYLFPKGKILDKTYQIELSNSFKNFDRVYIDINTSNGAFYEIWRFDYSSTYQDYNYSRTDISSTIFKEKLVSMFEIDFELGNSIIENMLSDTTTPFSTKSFKIKDTRLLKTSDDFIQKIIIKQNLDCLQEFSTKDHSSFSLLSSINTYSNYLQGLYLCSTKPFSNSDNTQTTELPIITKYSIGTLFIKSRFFNSIDEF